MVFDLIWYLICCNSNFRSHPKEKVLLLCQNIKNSELSEVLRRSFSLIVIHTFS
jgi:predicted nuclease of predicted toxin-antitoxin system